MLVIVSIDFDIDCWWLVNVKVVLNIILYVGYFFWIGKLGKLGGILFGL